MATSSLLRNIEDFNKNNHANVLLAGAKSGNGRGAEIVCLEFSDVILCIEWFMEKLKTDKKRNNNNNHNNNKWIPRLLLSVSVFFFLFGWQASGD